MPSLKARLVAFVLRATRKKAFASPEGLHRWIAASRRKQDHRPPRHIMSRFEVGQRPVHDFPVYEVTPRDGANGPHILYLHGGAFVFEITKFHWGLIGEMAERLSARVTVPIYPLAPEHGHAEIFGMAMQVYREAIAATPPDRLVVMGDSAGGTMAVVLNMMAKAEGLPRPGRQVLLSPGLDMTLEDPRSREFARTDPWLDIDGGMEAIRLYAGDLTHDDWRVSPIYGDLTSLPPTLILAGERDLLTPGTLGFVERARAAGASIDLIGEPQMFHVWPLMEMPEARIARNHIVEWLTSPLQKIQRPLRPLPRLWPQPALS